MKSKVRFSESNQKFRANFNEADKEFGMGMDAVMIHGATFYPNVSDDGVLTWTNDKGLQNPDPVSIKGEPGRDGSEGKAGADGKPGEDGYTPIKGVDYFDGKDGSPGKDGQPGRDGVDGYTPIKGIDYFDGKDGKDGAAGKDGQPGKDGRDGTDGVSPIVSVVDIDGGHRVTITDVDGAKEFDVMDGKDGSGGGSSVQSDWEQNDETQPDYVRNRPFYEKKLIDIQWDGDTTGKRVLDMSALGMSGMSFVQVSPYFYGINSLVGSVVYGSNLGFSSKFVNAEDIVSDYIPDVAIIEKVVAVVSDASALCNKLGIPDNTALRGIYFLLTSDGGYVRAFRSAETVIQTIDPKFFPETFGEVSWNDITDKPFYTTDAVNPIVLPRDLDFSVSYELGEYFGEDELTFYKVNTEGLTGLQPFDGGVAYCGDYATRDLVVESTELPGVDVLSIVEYYQVDETSDAPLYVVYLIDVRTDAYGIDTGVYAALVYASGYTSFEGIASKESDWMTITKEAFVPIDEHYLPSTVPVIPSASVGQTVVVKAVDESGRPTEWEAVDVASGGGGGSKLLGEITLTSENCTAENETTLRFNDETDTFFEKLMNTICELGRETFLCVSLAGQEVVTPVTFIQSGNNSTLTSQILEGNTIESLTLFRIRHDSLFVSKTNYIQAVAGGYPMTIKVYAT